MSDLISRSELIKELNKYCGNQRYLVSENIREIINNQPTAYIKDCKTCEKEHEQLAEWLEELKIYRKAERTLDNAYNNGYNKAIDDFSNEIDKYIERYDGTIYDEAYYTNVKSDFEDLKKIGNQLKEDV